MQEAYGTQDPQGAAPAAGVGQLPIAQIAATDAGAQSGSDFWDVGDPDFLQPEQPQGDEFSELVAVDAAGSRSRSLTWLLLVLVLAAGGWGAYEYLVEGENPLDSVIAQAVSVYDTLYKGLFGENDAVPTSPPIATRSPRAPLAPKRQVIARPDGTRLKVKAGNPYWYLPNHLLGKDRAVPPGTWTPEEEETLRAGLTHRFTYQHYKTVQDVRAARHAGSDEILREALQDKKLWTRMYGVVGLAEMHEEVPFKVLSDALMGARSELIANFFERFVKHPNPGQLYILREAVRGLDARGRIVALRGIRRSRDALRDLYLTAATLDPDRHVQAWVRQSHLVRGIRAARQDQLLAVIRGEVPADSLLHELKAHAQPLSPDKVLPTTATADDLDAEGRVDQTAEDDGVEFYDQDSDASEAKPALDQPDSETFEAKSR